MLRTGLFFLTTMPFNIVLVYPEIPNNTGNIGRLCLGTNSHLHLIKPLGFSLEDKQLKRSGLDYWPNLMVTVYENYQDFSRQHPNALLSYYSSHATKTYWNLSVQPNHFFVFGCESKGLPKEILSQQEQHTYKIPLAPNSIRSFNLANAVGIVVFEGLRQLQQPQ